jgi:hypothetical protein
MNNTHTRVMLARIAQVRPWIESSWTGTARDPFPRDVIKTWRTNPPGVDPLALVPEVTRLGHGVFSFRFESWDGQRWRVRVESTSFSGWHGFDLRETDRGCEVTHSIELELSGFARLVWPMIIAPIHDWCVESLLDRIEVALETGEVPAHTSRPRPWRAAASLDIVRLARQTAKLRKAVRP